jgi:ribokinase
MIGCVGDDQFGNRLLDGLAKDGIDLMHVSREAGVASGIAGILVDAAGYNSIVVTPGANHAFSISCVDAAAQAIESAAALVCQLETPYEAVARAIGIAHRGGVPVIFNPSPVRALDDALLGIVDYLIVNETEAANLSGIEISDHKSAALAAAKLLTRGARTVLLTMGEHGVHIADSKGQCDIPAVKVHAVDTTAAGDTFTGAFAVGVTQGLSTADAASMAQFAAALAVTRVGAQSSIPDREEVREFMAARSAGIVGFS